MVKVSDKDHEVMQEKVKDMFQEAQVVDKIWFAKDKKEILWHDGGDCWLLLDANDFTWKSSDSSHLDDLLDQISAEAYVEFLENEGIIEIVKNKIIFI